MKVIIYGSHLAKIGGVETFVKNFCKRMHKHFDLELNYPGQNIYLDVPINHRKNTTLEADVVILANSWGIVPTVKAKKVIQVIHADYSVYIDLWKYHYHSNPATTHHVCVGQNVKKQFEKVTGHKCDKVIYNLLDNYQPEPKQKNEQLYLVTCSRLSKEKGIERMLKLAQKINVPYRWDVFGDKDTYYAQDIIKEFYKTSIYFNDPTDKPQHYMSKADYVVQLSDTEGMPYAILEALQARTPVITTDYPAAHELITEGKNGHILDMDLNNFNLDMLSNIPKLATYKEKSSEDDWLKMINWPN